LWAYIVQPNLICFCLCVHNGDVSTHNGSDRTFTNLLISKRFIRSKLNNIKSKAYIKILFITYALLLLYMFNIYAYKVFYRRSSSGL
jgi:hypothetical protein